MKNKLLQAKKIFRHLDLACKIANHKPKAAKLSWFAIIFTAILLLSTMAIAAECDDTQVMFEIAPASESFLPNDFVRVSQNVDNLDPATPIEATIRLQMVEEKSRKVVAKTEEKLTIDTKYGKIKTLPIPEEFVTEYAVEGILSYSRPGCTGSKTSVAKINVEKGFFDEKIMGIPLWLLPIILALLAGGVVYYLDYRKKQEKEFKITFKR